VTDIRDVVQMAVSSGDLSQRATELTAADVIAALGRADPLGASLLRLSGTLSVSDFRSSARLLSEQTHCRPMIARLAIEEWLSCVCLACRGKGYSTTPKGGRRRCTNCDHTGRGRRTNQERQQYLGVSYVGYLSLVAEIDAARAALEQAESLAAGEVRAQLGLKLLK
jgi:hypothetical protein